MRVCRALCLLWLQLPHVAAAGTILLKGDTLRHHQLAPLLPLPNGEVVSATRLIQAADTIHYGDDDIVVIDTALDTAFRYADSAPTSLDAFGVAFDTRLNLIHPVTLTARPYVLEMGPLTTLLSQAGMVVAFETGLGHIPRGAIVVGASDYGSPPLPTRTPSSGSPTPTPTRTQAGGLLTATPTTPAQRTASPTPILDCIADCDADQEATLQELLDVIAMVLGDLDSGPCFGADLDQDGTLSVDELVAAVHTISTVCP